VADAATAVYEQSGYGPGDFDLLELHDAAAPAELIQYAEVGLCEAGEGHELIRSGATELGGRMPVNVSGGLLSRGHPLGATGCAQLVELCTHLRGRAGARQVPNARLAMAINGGGWLDSSYAVTVATIVRQFPA
jgi:acetyl-CoA acetyltransferase